jgi:hypothetical protein
MGGEWSASRPDRAFTPGERTPGTYCTGGWVGHRAGLDTEARRKNPLPPQGIEPRSPGRPARSQTLYCYDCLLQISIYFTIIFHLGATDPTTLNRNSY